MRQAQNSKSFSADSSFHTTLETLEANEELRGIQELDSTRYSSMSMSSGLMRRSLDRASLMMLMALQRQNQHQIRVEHPQCAALDTRWQHKDVEHIHAC